MLTRLSHGRSALTRRAVVLLLVAGAAACALPTLEIRPAAAEPGGAAPADRKLTGRLYLAVAGHHDDQIVAVDPATGKWERICEGTHAHRARVSPDKETLALIPQEGGIWTCATQKDSTPGRIFARGNWCVWSADSKQLIVSDGTFEKDKGSKYETWRMNANGTDVIKLAIPETDQVSDWSPDGKWIVTVSGRHRAEGSERQLYLMKPDGSDERRITQGSGENGGPRFSPDGRKVLYVHVEAPEKARSGLWTVNVDGTGAKRIVANEDLPAIEGCSWSPDGKHILVTPMHFERDGSGRNSLNGMRAGIMDADGKNYKELKFDDLQTYYIGPPEWR